MEQKKIRVTLPEYIYEIISKDEEDLDINRNKLCNIIFSIYSRDVSILNESYKSNSNRILQFNLIKENYDNYYDILKTCNIQNESDFFRKIFYAYADQPKYRRELEILSKSVDLINESIKTKKKLKVKYKDIYRVIEPYFIISSDNETRNYVFCYCESNREYRNYRIINIKPLNTSQEDFEKYDKEYVESIRTNFDPFLSYGKKIKVRLTEEGEKHLERVATNRPKVISKQDGVYEFECSDRKAKLYFPELLKNAEILEPVELRKWFREMFREVADLYDEK